MGRRESFKPKQLCGRGVDISGISQSTLQDWGETQTKMGWKSIETVAISLFYLRQSLPVSADSCTFDHCFLGQELEDGENYFI